MINIYVGNLPYKTSEADLADLFGAFGKVERSSIVMDRQTGRSRGFGFVEMVDHAEGTAAIEALAGEEWRGRPLTINEARPRGSGKTGGATGFTSSSASYGESSGYSNSLASSPETTARAGDEPAGLGQEDGAGASDSEVASVPPLKPTKPPASGGYSNSLVDPG